MIFLLIIPRIEWIYALLSVPYYPCIAPSRQPSMSLPGLHIRQCLMAESDAVRWQSGANSYMERTCRDSWRYRREGYGKPGLTEAGSGETSLNSELTLRRSS